ncbi:MAG: hypothetical protein HBSAPP02_14610 [Phycisphaerae bacterium]|nr:MAG: hypothetical protein HRU71_07490 [Planctomycetia bacterium]RIK71313.1 MAG: hypothetical protein DCC66_01620 [Planctomycetota bacterium]GJQ26429.1 MAG: hypothetical protein HBSAPP02_14610 [Phycisphaerae bacterium]
MQSIDRRGETVALLGALLALVASVVLGILGVWTRGSSITVWAAGFQVFCTIGVWILCWIQVHQQRLLEEEKLELAELERQRREKLGGAQTIFDDEDADQMEKLAMGRRLRSIERYLVPTLALIGAAAHVAAALLIFPWRFQFPPIAGNVGGPIINDRVLIFFTGGLAFVFFMMSRYALGMSRLAGYSHLRAGGNFMFGACVVCFAASIGILVNLTGVETADYWVGMGIGVLLVLLACETVLNFVLDFYRPRTPGQEQRPFYDSRFLGMFSEPGGILRNISRTIDYQFGFKVSETWFYKLMGRVVVPLLLVQAAVIMAVTCIVVVPPGHQAVIERLGRRPTTTAKPGVHLTWPWPLDRATLIPVERVQRLEIGYEKDAETEKRLAGLPILWTKKHYKKEYQLLVADRAASAASKTPINLVSMNMPVQWRVKDADAEVIRFHAQSKDVAKILESLAFRELTRYAAGADILDLLGKGGLDAAAHLHEGLQRACDQAGDDGEGLGVQIVYVGIGGVHPPPDQDVAKTYEEVVTAYEKRESTIRKAEGEAAATKMLAAGPTWQKIYDAIRLEDSARHENGASTASATEQVERMLREESGGTAREVVAMAQMKTMNRVFREKSDAEFYRLHLAAYESSPYTYMLRSYLRMLEEGLKDIRKYVILLDEPDKVVYDLDLKPPVGFEALGAELAASEAKGD